MFPSDHEGVATGVVVGESIVVYAVKSPSRPTPSGAWVIVASSACCGRMGSPVLGIFCSVVRWMAEGPCIGHELRGHEWVNEGVLGRDEAGIPHDGLS